MLVADFDYHLPDSLIARQPLADRASARMLHLVRGNGDLEDRGFRELPSLLRSDDLLVVNNTRVFPARLFGHRSGSRAQRPSLQNPATKGFLQGKVEVLLTKKLSADGLVWEALVHPGRKLQIGERLYFGGGGNEASHELSAEIVARGTFGERHLRFDRTEDFSAALERLGHIPLPPYIDRPDTSADREQYQTVYAKPTGSVAAPTAGLHFTPDILEQIHQRGIEIAEITLHVGLGTFQPIREEVVENHKLHTEWYEIGSAAAKQIQRAQDDGRRIVAVGTTTVRTLEFARQQSSDGHIRAQAGEADIFIYPGFQFRVVGALLTNFHLPKSTLLMLVAAFAGLQPVLKAYEHAVLKGYRFYSYGDCMFLE